MLEEDTTTPFCFLPTDHSFAMEANNKYRCIECGHVSRDQASAKKHFKKEHTQKNKKVECTLCFESFDYAGSLPRHAANAHPDYIYDPMDRSLTPRAGYGWNEDVQPPAVQYPGTTQYLGQFSVRPPLAGGPYPVPAIANAGYRQSGPTPGQHTGMRPPLYYPVYRPPQLPRPPLPSANIITQAHGIHNIPTHPPQPGPAQPAPHAPAHPNQHVNGAGNQQNGAGGAEGVPLGVAAGQQDNQEGTQAPEMTRLRLALQAAIDAIPGHQVKPK